jgi:hypothetical protein
MNAYVRPRFPLAYYPSGAASDTIPLNERTVNEDARQVQRQLLGIGFSVGPQGADGRWWTNSANGTMAFARWYNALPEGAPPTVADLMAGRNLTRGAPVTVDRAMTGEKREALMRFAARASDQLTPLQQINTTITTPPPDAGTPWGTIVIGGVAIVTAVTVFSYLANRPSTRKA